MAKCSCLLLKKPPATLQELLNPTGDQRSTNFKAQIRSYNAMFAMTSMGGKVDHRLMMEEVLIFSNLIVKTTIELEHYFRPMV
jgi:hypothetical protein